MRAATVGIALTIAAATGVPAREAVAQGTVLIEGRVVDEAGRPLAGLGVGAIEPLALTGGGTVTGGDGAFTLTVPPGLYVVTVDPPPPLNPAAIRVDARAGGVKGVLLQASTHPAPAVADVPPRASLIQVSPPDSAGRVTLSGAPGAVAPLGYLAFVTLDTGHVARAQAAADGSFVVSIFGGLGCSILVKVDPLGTMFPTLRDEDLGPSLLAGTIVRVAEPPATGAGVPFGRAGTVGPNGPEALPAWTFQGTVSAQALAPGGVLRVQGTLRIISPALTGSSAMSATGRLTLHRMSGADGVGSLAHNLFVSTIMTPTGFPIERQPGGGDHALAVRSGGPLAKTAPNRAEAAIDLALALPLDLPHGLYLPVMVWSFDGVPIESPQTAPVTVIETLRRDGNTTYLPVVRVGTPGPPRLPWLLLADTLSNGSRGVRAVEDREHFGLSSRIRMAEALIVPRTDHSGRPLTYRLEPFAPTIGLVVGGRPSLPLIPLRFPSGGLTVRILKPDGSTDLIGPAPFVQPRLKDNGLSGSTVRDLSNLAGGDTNVIREVYQLTTLDPRFEVQFGQDGRHEIAMEGSVEDVWGNTWHGGGRYEVHVARLLSLDTAVLPGTPFEVGDVLSPGVTITPPVPAEVEVRVRLAPDSDPARMAERVVKGRANRFGYFHPAGGGVALDAPGEYRVDVTAAFRDDQGALWMGARTWGSVVAARDTPIVAHGRRGMVNSPFLGSQWFFRTDTEFPTLPSFTHPNPPFHSGDVFWAQASDTAFVMMAFQDPVGSLGSLLQARAPGANIFGPGTFDERLPLGEIPLFSSRPDGIDPHVDPARVDLWGYTYRFVERPLVAVREMVAEDGVPLAYWSFDDPYLGQIGVGVNGDLPGEIKFQYGGVVLRGAALDQPRYAVYGSLFVLVSDDDPHGGTRVFPPFQGNGGGPSGGPIMTLKGRDIDLFLHLTGVRPGSVLEVGDVFSVAGAVGPPLPALVNYTVTKPDGQPLAFGGRANLVGYYHRPGHDVLVDQAGLWRVDVQVSHDGRTSAGQVAAPFPRGDVLGSAAGRFFVYAVPRGSAPLEVNLPATAFLSAPAGFSVDATAPAGVTLTGGHASAMMPGVLLESRELVTAGGPIAYTYDPVRLAQDVPNLDVDVRARKGPTAADAVTISLYATGTDAAGRPVHAARVLALHGPELFAGSAQAATTALVAAVLPASRSVTVGKPATAFATVINAGSVAATACGLAPLVGLPADFSFRTTNPVTNEVTGAPNARVDIPAGGAQSFVLALTPTASFGPVEVQLLFDCANASPAPITVGLNTLLLSAPSPPGPDVVALAATTSQDGIVRLPGPAGAGAFAVATINVATEGEITVSADTGAVPLPVSLLVCETHAATGACRAAPAPTVTVQMGANAPGTFGVFATAAGSVAFDPAGHRIFARFRDGGGVVRGATSVAVRTD